MCHTDRAGSALLLLFAWIALLCPCRPAAGQAVGRTDWGLSNLPDDPGVSSRAQTTDSAQAKANAEAAGTLRGTLTSASGDPMADADVTLTGDRIGALRKTRTDAAGHFVFSEVPAGGFRLLCEASGLTPATFSGTLGAGQMLEVPAMKLGAAKVEADVVVTASQEDLAEAEIKVEEHQRLAGFLPNFFVAYDPHAAPLRAKQKFELSWKNVIDPANFIVSGAIAGVEQAKNTFAEYGQGAAGYGKRLGAAQGDLIIGTFMGGAVLPTIFRQDPRYFYKGTGTVRSRVFYSLTRAVVEKGDNGKWQPAYSGILGDLSAGAISSLYYPAADRHGAGLTVAEGFLNIGGDALGNVVQEFLFKHLTPHAPNYTQQQGRE